MLFLPPGIQFVPDLGRPPEHRLVVGMPIDPVRDDRGMSGEHEDLGIVEDLEGQGDEGVPEIVGHPVLRIVALADEPALEGVADRRPGDRRLAVLREDEVGVAVVARLGAPDDEFQDGSLLEVAGLRIVGLGSLDLVLRPGLHAVAGRDESLLGVEVSPGEGSNLSGAVPQTPPKCVRDTAATRYLMSFTGLPIRILYSADIFPCNISRNGKEKALRNKELRKAF